MTHRLLSGLSLAWPQKVWLLFPQSHLLIDWGRSDLKGIFEGACQQALTTADDLQGRSRQFTASRAQCSSAVRASRDRPWQAGRIAAWQTRATVMDMLADRHHLS